MILKKDIVTLSIALGLALAGSRAHAGSHAHGADYHDRGGDNVWFLGDQPVGYCVDVADGFKLSRADAEALAREVINEWLAFFAKYGLLDKPLNTDLLQGRRVRTAAGGLVMAREFEPVATCDAPDEQIQILFGATNADVAPFVAKKGSVGLGLAVRRDAPAGTTRRGGTIWLSGDATWVRRDHLKHVLMHEFGHVFGMQHDSVHVMDSHTADHLFKTHSLGTIESPLWPYRFAEGDSLLFSFEPVNRQGCSVARKRADGKYDVEHGLFAVTALPPTVRRLVHDSTHGPNQCVRVAIEHRGVEKDGQTKIALSVLDLMSLERHVFEGRLSPGATRRGPSFHGPVKYRGIEFDIRWPQVGTFFFDEQAFGLPGTGYLEAAGMKLGLEIRFDEGPELRVYQPDTGAWWSLIGRSYDWSGLNSNHIFVIEKP